MGKADVVQLKIEWAVEHIDKAERHLAVFFHDLKPYQLGFKDDADSGGSILYVKRAQELPADLPLIIGDAISNLYSSLDYLACELVPTEKDISTKTAFPISEKIPFTKDEKVRYNGQVRGMAEEAKKIIKDTEPYRGRDNNLWTLHKLNNINKHRTLLTVAYGAAISSPSGTWNVHIALEEGTELLRVPIDFPDKDKTAIFPVITFNEPEADIVGHPLLTVLRGCLGDVQRVAALLRPYRRAQTAISGGS